MSIPGSATTSSGVFCRPPWRQLPDSIPTRFGTPWYAGISPQNIVRYHYRPFDVRWLYWEPHTKLLDEKRPEYRNHIFEDNTWLVAQQKSRRDWSAPQLATALACIDLMDRSASFFPAYLKPGPGIRSLRQDPDMVVPGTLNLSRRAFAVLSEIGTGGPVLFYHTIAILHSPAYRRENAGALRQDWPRVPIPSTKEAFVDSAYLGFRLAVKLAVE